MRAQVFQLHISVRSAILVLALATMPGICAAQATGAPPANVIHMCSLLTQMDVEPLVGERQPMQETKGGITCMWGDTGSDPNKPRLLIQAPAFGQSNNPGLGRVDLSVGDKVELSFKANRKQAFDDKDAHAKDEPQLGKNAFSALTNDGAEIIIAKKSTILNIRYITGKRGTPENVAAIRKIAVKVSASF
jgi:hypothetical protein